MEITGLHKDVFCFTDRQTVKTSLRLLRSSLALLYLLD